MCRVTSEDNFEKSRVIVAVLRVVVRELAYEIRRNLDLIPRSSRRLTITQICPNLPLENTVNWIDGR